MNRYKNLEVDLKSIENPKFIAQTVILSVDFVFALLGIIGFYIHNKYLVWISQLILFISIVPLFLLMALQADYLVAGIDFCKNTRTSMLSQIFPAKNFGIGKYITCPSTEAKQAISIAKYQIMCTFDNLYNEISNIGGGVLKKEEYGKRNNKYYKYMIHNLEYGNWTEELTEEELQYSIKTYINLIDYNHILGDLQSIGSCQSAENAANRIEETYCIDNFKYVGIILILYIFGIFGVLLLACGLNKVIIIMNRVANKSLLNKNKFKNDDDDSDDD